MSAEPARRAADTNELPGPREMDRARVREMLDEWAAEESDYDERAMQILRNALDEDRLSYRRRFPA